jgi:DNA ligase D-like protein (predicted 3'-phosphoesterase)
MSKKKRIFMVHKHSATKLHYDFRFEVDGKLKSWALKALPLIPSSPVLAILVPDHPFWYRHFEGVIPEGQYGAGPVMIWDKGLYTNFLKDESGKDVSLEKSLENGLLLLWLEGHKLKGGYILVRISKKQKWLMIKMPDEYVIKGRKQKNWDRSIKSGKTIEEILEKIN